MATSNTELAAKLDQANGGSGKVLSPAMQVHNYLTRHKDQIRAALPRHLNSDRMARIVLTTIRQSPDLLQCSVESLMGATMQAVQLGLEPGLLGHCYFLPFNRKIKGPGGKERWIKEVQFIIGYRGLLDLARRSGSIKTIQAQAVYSEDLFEFEYSFEPKLRHVPKLGERGELTGFYAFAITKDGGTYFEYMTRADVDKIRARSKAKDSGPWQTDYEQMGRKTVLRRLCKYLPLSIEIQDVITHEDEKEFGEERAQIDFSLGELPPALPEPEITLEFEDQKQSISEAQEKLEAARAANKEQEAEGEQLSIPTR